MKKERIYEDEIYAVIRKNGLYSIEDVGANVLETDSSLTLIENIKSLNNETMKKVILPMELPNRSL